VKKLENYILHLMLVIIPLACATYSFGQGIKLEGVRGGLTAATNGFGVDVLGVLSSKKAWVERSVSLNFQTLRVLKETKVQNSATTNPKSYVLAKVNAASTVRLALNLDRKLGLAEFLMPTVAAGISGGPSLGILKPYYVGYQDPESKNMQPQIIVQNQETLDNQGYIYGPANWTNGLKELRYNLGLHADIHLNVTWNESFYAQQWKSGIRLDYFPKGLNVLYSYNTKVFTSIYTSYLIGG
jgi:hypothetical protein